MIRRNILGFVAWGGLSFFLSLSSPTWGQTGPPAPPGPPPPSASPAQDLNQKLFAAQANQGAWSRQDYQLGAGDVVEISVFNIKELNRTLEISANGKITLPFVNEVVVEGLTTQDLERKLVTLLEAKVIKNPQVTVSIKEYRSRPIYVLGAVQKPGMYQVVRKLHLIDALSLAGGFGEKAGERVFLRKASTQQAAPAGGPPNPPSPAVLEIDLRELLLHGNAGLNYPIEAGDVVNVPLKVEKVYYVLGDVGKPGAYEFKEKDEEVRVSQALATAGGLLRTANVKDVVIVRQDSAGKKKYIAVNFKQVIEGRREDLAVQPNDLIFVPNSATKNATQALVNGLASILTAGIVYIR